MFRSLLIAATASLAFASYAQVTPIAESPLNTGGVSIVRPNVTLLFDDSGSMEFQFTPDYLANGTVARLCDNGVAQVTGSSPSNRLSSAASACPTFSYSIMRDGMNNWPVLEPSPPAYSPDINQQFYNPDVSYSPPIKADLSSYPSMNGTSTANGGAAGASASSRNWRSVPLDGFGTYTANTFNVEKFPSWYFCDQTYNANCAHDTSYNFPELNLGQNSDKRTRIEPDASGTTQERAAFAAPHYYRLGVSYYCQDEQFTSCIKSTVPSADYIYPARVRFCKDTDKLICQKNFDSANGYIVPSYIHAPMVPSSAAVAASTTLNVKTLTGTSGGQLTSLNVNGTEVGGMALNQGSTNALANAIAARINSIGLYTATASGSNVVITANTVGVASNGIPVSVEATAGVTAGTKWTFTLSNAASSNLAKNNVLSSLTLNGVAITGGSIVNSTTGKAAFTAAAVKNWAERNGTNGYTATVTTSGETMTVVLQRSSLANYSSSDDATTAVVNSTTPSSGTRLTTPVTAVRTGAVINVATFSFNNGTVAVSANGTLAGGKDAVIVSIDRGIWTRVNILPGQTYPHPANRVDCAGATCTYNEEMTNFANWFAYYRFRLNSTKTAAGQAFGRLNDNYRVGYHTINGSTSTISLGVKPFDVTDTSSTAHRKAWYAKLYAQKTNGGTPLRQALSTVGRYYGGKLTSSTDPIEYSCQKNYTILVTDGYWNGNGSRNLDNTSISASQDSDATSARSSRESGVFDGRNVGDTLADVAQYYYNIDLRPSGANSKNNVPTNARDDNSAQHMNTYTMGLGIDGLMTYRKDYLTATSGDFAKITSGSAGCSWEASQTTICNWPIPSGDTPTAVDDLWHAAVNGRGQYFSARTPLEAAEGIKQALSDVVSVTGAAAASATSSPNVTQTDNFIYSSTYQTSFWDGEVVAQRIDYQTGTVLDAIEWRASEKLNAQADALGANPNARTLLTLDTTATGANKAKPFDYANLTATERGWFAGHCASSQFGQCAENIIGPDRRSYADNAQNVVEYLRGRNDSDVFTASGVPFGYTQLFRDTRTNRLGDTVNSVPLFISKPVYTFDYDLPVGHETYKQFQNRVYPQCAAGDLVCEANPPARRPGILYMAANDGMLHAMDGDTGIERFAYVPRTTMPEMWRLADQNYATRHRYFVDGSPVSMDISNSSGQWKTIVVGGYRSGAAGYYALDVTDPTAPKVLWEVCNNSALCNNAIPEMGLSFGNPVITRMPENHPSLAGRWVVLVTSGYNNVPSVNTQPTAVSSNAGSGKGFLFVLDPQTGALLKTYATNEGTTTNPINLGKLSTFAPNFYFDGTSKVAYSGDLKGNIWRFDLAVEPNATTAVRKIATLTKDGRAQPISTRMEIGLLPNRPEPVLYIATGQYVSIDDLGDNSTQSLYAIRDPYFGAPTSGAGVPANNFYANPRAYTTKPFVQQTISDEAVTQNSITNTIRKISQNEVDWDTKSGWYVDFPDTGERVSLDPVLVLGTLTVSTNVVSSTTADACEVGGYSWLYQFDYTKGTRVVTAPNDAVAYKVPSALVVGTVIVRLPSGVLKIITTTATGTKISYGLNVNTSSMMGRRISWRELPQ